MQTHKKIIYYGAGEISQHWINSNPENAPHYIIEKNPLKKNYLGIPVVRPEEVINPAEYIVLITVSTTSSQTFRNSAGHEFGDELLMYLKQIGFSEVFDLPEASNRFFPRFLSQINPGEYLWLSEKPPLARNVSAIDKDNGVLLQKIDGYWCDSESKKIFRDILEFRKNLDFSNYVYPELSHRQYLDPVFWSYFKSPIRALDLGGFNGDSAEDLLAFKSNIIDFIIVAEPSLTNFEELLKYRNSLESFNRSKIQPLLAAIGSTDNIVKIEGKGASSRLIEADFNKTSESIEMGNFELAPVLRIDQSLSKLGINYIKMDIEGGEISALKSAEKYIGEFSPFLAIAAYHKPSDLFEVPALVLKFNPNYKFIIRVYGHLLKETVIYCVPSNSR